MVKTDYDYQVKRVYHRLLRKSMARWLPNPKSARVLCLPGAEAREVVEVYDELGVPRGNLVGFENDRQVYDSLGAQKTGIDLHYGDILKFLKETDKVFDVISLDYTQTPGRETLDALIDISNRRLLTGRSLLHTNFYASRLSEGVMNFLPVLRSEEFTDTPDGFNTHRSYEIGKTGGFKRVVEDIRDLKDHGITTFALLAFMGSTVDFILGRYGEVETKEQVNAEFETEKSTPGNKPIREAPGCGYRDAQQVVSAFYAKNRPYVVSDLDRFSYVSNDGSLMMSDIFFVSDFTQLFEEMKKYFHGFLTNEKGNQEAYNIYGNGCGFNKAMKRFGGIGKRYGDARRKFEGFLHTENQPDRRDITPREELSAELAIKLLGSGWTYEMFEDKFRDVTPARIAAYKAHITMGTYQEAPKVTEKRVVEKVRPELKKGAIFFDSNPGRLRKNLDRLVSTNIPLDSASVLNGIGKMGLLKRGRYDLYVLNTQDPICKDAFTDLALRFGESRFYLNLLLIGDSTPLEEEIEAAKELGVKIRVTSCNTSDGFLNQDKPLNLEQAVLDLH